MDNDGPNTEDDIYHFSDDDGSNPFDTAAESEEDSTVAAERSVNSKSWLFVGVGILLVLGGGFWWTSHRATTPVSETLAPRLANISAQSAGPVTVKHKTPATTAKLSADSELTENKAASQKTAVPSFGLTGTSVPLSVTPATMPETVKTVVTQPTDSATKIASTTTKTNPVETAAQQLGCEGKKLSQLSAYCSARKKGMTPAAALSVAMTTKEAVAAQTPSEKRETTNTAGMAAVDLTKVTTQLSQISNQLNEVSRNTNTLMAKQVENSKKRQERRAKNRANTGNKSSNKQAAKKTSATKQSQYFVRAAIPGRAWLSATNGRELTVSVGDSVGNLGTIVAINPDQGNVVTSKGKIIEFAVEAG